MTLYNSSVLYTLIVNQLRHDGLSEIADALLVTFATELVSVPSDHLDKIVKAYFSQLPDGRNSLVVERGSPDTDVKVTNSSLVMEDLLQKCKLEGNGTTEQPIIDLDLTTVYISKHKGPCNVAAIDIKGRYAATGSSDSSIKAYDIGRMRGRPKGENDSSNNTHHVEELSSPLLSTYMEHTQRINSLDFHPTSPDLLASGSSDCTIRFFDVSKINVRRSLKCIHETSGVSMIKFHPSGDYLAAATVGDNTIRLYDLNTFACFTSANEMEYHSFNKPINGLDYSHEGRYLVSVGSDGALKLWDGATMACTTTIGNAHNGDVIKSAQFSKDPNYILSNSTNGTIKLWDIRLNAAINTYYGASSESNAVLNNSEDFIFSGGGMNRGKNTSHNMMAWQKNTKATAKETLPYLQFQGHQEPVSYIATSKSTNLLISCSLDNRARFWIPNE